MAKDEAALVRDERDHICDPYFIETLFKKHKIDPVDFLKRMHNIPNQDATDKTT
jgi:hypothetical protein